MKQNVGSIDRKIRLLIGSILLLTGVFAPVSFELRIGILAAGIIAILTGYLSF
jgi:hypothetical protein